MTLNIKTLSITHNTRHYDTQHKHTALIIMTLMSITVEKLGTLENKYYDYSRFFAVMLSVVILSVVAPKIYLTK